MRALLTLVPGRIPRLTDANGIVQAPPLDWGVAAFTAGVALLTGILFGLFPALHTSNPDLAVRAQRRRAQRHGPPPQPWSVPSLVVLEMALSLVLLIGAALLIRTFVGLRSVSPGLDPHGVLTLQTSMAGGSYPTTAQNRRLLHASRAAPAKLCRACWPRERRSYCPWKTASICRSILPATRPPRENSKATSNGAPSAAIISRSFAFRCLRGRRLYRTRQGQLRAVGNHQRRDGQEILAKSSDPRRPDDRDRRRGSARNSPTRRARSSGSSAASAETGLSDGKVRVMYIPQSQTPQGITDLANSIIPLSWAIRTAGDPMAMRAAIEREFRAVDGVLPISQVRTMDQVMASSIGRQNFNMTLLTVFAAIALLLASIGIYGLMAYSVEQRAQEIGIRMALGASQRDMLRLVVFQGMKLAGIGVAIGLVCGLRPYSLAWPPTLRREVERPSDVRRRRRCVNRGSSRGRLFPRAAGGGGKSNPGITAVSGVGSGLTREARRYAAGRIFCSSTCTPINAQS